MLQNNIISNKCFHNYLNLTVFNIANQKCFLRSKSAY